MAPLRGPTGSPHEILRITDSGHASTSLSCDALRYVKGDRVIMHYDTESHIALYLRHISCHVMDVVMTNNDGDEVALQYYVSMAQSM